jgi:hypothetical protein
MPRGVVKSLMLPGVVIYIVDAVRYRIADAA